MKFDEKTSTVNQKSHTKLIHRFVPIRSISIGLWNCCYQHVHFGFLDSRCSASRSDLLSNICWRHFRIQQHVLYKVWRASKRISSRYRTRSNCCEISSELKICYPLVAGAAVEIAVLAARQAQSLDPDQLRLALLSMNVSTFFAPINVTSRHLSIPAQLT